MLVRNYNLNFLLWRLHALEILESICVQKYYDQHANPKPLCHSNVWFEPLWKKYEAFSEEYWKHSAT